MKAFKENPKQASISYSNPNYNPPPPDYNDVLMKSDMYLNEKSEDLSVENMTEAQLCFKAMKEIYNSRMKEYVTELTFISEKLQKYDEILSKK